MGFKVPHKQGPEDAKNMPEKKGEKGGFRSPAKEKPGLPSEIPQSGGLKASTKKGTLD